MKKLTAILLTGCFTFQMMAGSVVSVSAADFSSGPSIETQLPEQPPAEEILPDSLPDAGDSSASEDTETFHPEETMTDNPEEFMDFSSFSEEEPVFEDGTTEIIPASGTNASGIDVVITSTLPFSSNASAEVSIESPSVVQSKTITLQGDQAVFRADAFFENLPEGNYQLTIRTRRFAAYSQSISVREGYTSKVQIHSSKIEGYDQGNHPGFLIIGDVTGDHAVDNNDKTVMLTALHNSSADPVYDLNGDSSVNLADLQYLAHSLTDKPVLSSIESLVYTKTVDSTAEGGTIVQGNLDEILSNQGSVTLSPAEGNTISEAHPVAATFDFSGTAGEAGIEMEGFTIQAPVETESNDSLTSAISDGVAEVTVVNPETHKEEIMEFSLANAAASAALFRSSGTVTVGADGSLTLNFGQKIAVKKVTIKITGTRKNDALVNISKVEFVNDMESRIPAPQLGIPSQVQASIKSKQIDLSWKPEPNVTGYELYISGKAGKRGNSSLQTQIVGTAVTSHTFTAINDQNLINNEPYTVKVRSVNVDWKSEWSDTLTVTPKAETVPPAPDNLSAVGGYRSIQIKWKDMDDTDSYNLYCKGPKDESFVKVKEALTATSYTLTELEDNATYQIYVTGINEMGEGPASITSEATTIIPDFPKIPNYNLLNTSNGEGNLAAHIQNITIGNNGGSRMVDSLLDKNPRSGLGLADSSFSSYWMKEDWDDGVNYKPSGDEKGITLTLDKNYKMSYLTFGTTDYNYSFQNAAVWYWDNDGQRTELNSRLLQKLDENNNTYYLLKFEKAIETNKLQFCLSTANKRLMKISEIHLHHYDSLEDDIMALYADEMHTILKDEVTEETIQALEERVNTKDKVSQEYHPARDELLKELDVAKGILANRQERVYPVNVSITAPKDRHLNFSGLNAWQPLGKTAYSGERLILFVGHNSRKSGQNADIKLVFAQNHAESSGFYREWNLNVGRNELTIPNLQSISGVEKGGQLYAVYTGNNASDRYGIRVVGGQAIPSLNLIGLNENERNAAIDTYVNELQEHVEHISETHTNVHESINNKNIKLPYDERNCIINATDILIDQMMYSVPATQIWKGLSGSSVSEKAASLKKALKAAEEAMLLAYQHKGLSNAEGTPAQDRLPSQHLNIRYMRMFAGAFMYAAGNHIGIEYDQTSILSSVKTIADLGWGIAHEIGHNINEPSYTVAEITNNYFAQLFTIKKNGLRFQMPNVYEKVTSGTVGRSSNLATQLALYWQLHLAFDNGADDAVYSQYQQQFDNLFFARVDSYSRKPDRAPQSGLTIGNDKDQNLMRLACAAANKNILPFFERWGMIPDETTRNYAAKYGNPETKAIYYVNPSARDYRAAHLNEESSLSIAGKNVASASIKTNQNQVTVNISASASADAILGYEILRSMTSNGEVKKEVVGFTESKPDGSATYIDTVSSVNNRVMTYEVRPVDKFLNYGNSAVAGSSKIQTDGRLEKEDWKVSTSNMSASNDTILPPTEEDPDNGFGNSGQKVQYAIDYVIDNKAETAYTGNSSADGFITIDMGRVQEITSLQYRGGALSDMTIEVSPDGAFWKSVKAHATLPASDNRHTVWFDSVDPEAKDDWIGTYDARYIRLLFHKSEAVSISEIDICGPSGDNLEFYQSDSQTPAVGILKNAYQFGKNDTDVIPAGSLIFTGTYKGNPAYNVVMLYDADGNVIGIQKGADGADTVEAEQVILAEIPENGALGETSDGTWIYYIKPDSNGKISDETMAQLKKSIRGELYRVDNALTNEGERVVSDTLPITVNPENLPTIDLTSGGNAAQP